MDQYTNRAMYTNSPTNDSPSGDGTQKAKGRTGPSNQSLTPLTIKQLGNAVQLAPGDVFKVDNKDLNMVTIVGVIMEKKQQSTNVAFHIDDGTGVIQARVWTEPEDKSDYISQSLANLDAGTYVRLIGHLQSFNGEKSLVAFRVIPITDFNEVTFHHLEVIQVHLANTRPAPVDGRQSNTGNGYNNNYSNSNSNYSNNNYNNNYSGNNFNQYGGQQGNFTDPQRAILQVLRDTPESPEGVPIQYLDALKMCHTII